MVTPLDAAERASLDPRRLGEHRLKHAGVHALFARHPRVRGLALRRVVVATHVLVRRDGRKNAVGAPSPGKENEDPRAPARTARSRRVARRFEPRLPETRVLLLDDREALVHLGTLR